MAPDWPTEYHETHVDLGSSEVIWRPTMEYVNKRMEKNSRNEREEKDE
jgi:hypothetical protein